MRMSQQNYTRRSFLKAIGLGAASLTITVHTNAAQQKSGEKLNFVFILVDDLGWIDTGCYGSRFYETRNIDKLASQGMKFTNGYAACAV